jgi:hypothetical protein
MNIDNMYGLSWGKKIGLISKIPSYFLLGPFLSLKSLTRGDIKAMLDAFKNLTPNYDAEAVESKIPQIYKQTWYGNDDSFSILELVLRGSCSGRW